MHNRILWIDDEEKILEAIPVLENKGFSIHGMTDSEKASKELEKHIDEYYLILLDLKMPKKNGIDIYKEIIRIKPQLPIILVSAYLDDDEWKKKIKLFEDSGIKVKSFAKPIPVNDRPRFAELVALIQESREEFLKSKDLNPFILHYEEIKNADDSYIDSIYDIASKMNFEFVRDYFKNNEDIEWVIIRDKPGNIIEYGQVCKRLDSSYLEAVQKSSKNIIFAYKRPAHMEELKKNTLGEPINWSKKKNDDYYPTIMIAFKNGVHEKFDFDTGSRQSFISYEELRRHGIIPKQMIPIYSEINDQQYRYYDVNIECKVLGKSTEKNIILQCQAVKEWEGSPFVKNYSERYGLLGRELIYNNKIKLLLDGVTKTTDLISEI